MTRRWALRRKKVGKAGFSDKEVRLVHGDAQDLAASLPPGVLFDAVRAPSVPQYAHAKAGASWRGSVHRSQ
jgi:hypothetical protein